MKSLNDIGLPPGFEQADDFNAETDEDEGKVYESVMLETQQDFATASAALADFVAHHFAGEVQIHSEDIVGVRSCTMITHASTGDVTGQLTDFGDYRGGYLRCVRNLT